jgi:hypothetical protein
MTIEYLEAQRARGNTSDMTGDNPNLPASTEVNFIFLDKDTGKEYIYNGSTWSEL